MPYNTEQGKRRGLCNIRLINFPTPTFSGCFFNQKDITMKNFYKATAVLFVVSQHCIPTYAGPGIEEIGDYMQVIVPAYAFGMAMNETDWCGAMEFSVSFLAMETTVLGLKTLIKEERPDKSDDNSFPSGHTAAAFSGATFIHKRYGLKQAIVPYLLASFTGFSRIYANKHHLHDVLAGAAISSAMTWIFVSKRTNVNISAGAQSINVHFNTTF